MAIHAITQTMIGEFLYKYTTKALNRGFTEKRHRRFFWVHPYTKTLYWSTSDPGAYGTNQSTAKSGEFHLVIEAKVLVMFNYDPFYCCSVYQGSTINQ
jgi:hypothetical protein